MKYEQFIDLAGKLPVIETENLLAGVPNPSLVEVQLSRWLKAGKLIRLKKGVYVLPQPFRKTEIFEPYVASLLLRPSYLSLEKALEYHDLIPEGVRVFTSVTPKSPYRFKTSIGEFAYQHLKPSLFWGYVSITLKGQTAFIAYPEKALLDLIYLNKIKVTKEYLEELRLQNIKKFSIERFSEFARRFDKPRISRAARIIKAWLTTEKRKEKTL